jgi:hypothetical protein
MSPKSADLGKSVDETTDIEGRSILIKIIKIQKVMIEGLNGKADKEALSSTGSTL